MSEMARPDVIEGTVLEPVPPYDSPQEARDDLEEAFTLLRDGNELMDRGVEQLSHGHFLLRRAEERGAHAVLGFTSFQECLLDGVQQYLSTRLAAGRRKALTVDMRKRYNLSARDLAERLGVSHTTTNRDLLQARRAGQIEDEGESVVSKDGVVRRVNPPKARRPDFRRTFDVKAAATMKAVNSLKNTLADDRWRDNRDDVATKWRAELTRSFGDLADFIEQLGPAERIDE